MILDLYIYPHPVLLQAASPITNFDDNLAKLIDDMTQTMYEGSGVGLAAPQVGISKRLFIVDTSAPNEEPSLRAYINPEILLKDDPLIWNEGCLSLPGLYRDVPSFGHVVIKAQDVHGNVFQEEARELRAVALLHEFAHLEGKVFIDRLSPLKKSMAKKFWAKNSQKQTKKTYSDSQLHCVFPESMSKKS